MGVTGLTELVERQHHRVPEKEQTITVRVLHVVSTGRRRGAEMFASDLVAALGNEGIDQHVAVLRGTKPVDVLYQAPVTVVGEERANEALRVGTVRSLRRLLRAWEPDILQAHGGEALKYSFLADRRKGHRVVYRRIGSVHPRTTFGLRKLAYGAMMRRANHVVALGKAAREETIQTFGVRPERIVTIPNGVDPSRIRPHRTRDEVRRSLGVAADASVVLSLGALTWEKDPLAQVDVAARVLRRSDRAVFLIAGEGPLRAEVAQAVDEVRLGGRILLLGNRTDPGDLLASSDVLLMTSRTEGMPGAAIEGAMAGIPVVAYAIGGISEAVREGTTGLLARPGDREALAGDVLALLNDENARRAMGRAAMEWSRTRFDIGVVAPRYLRLYRHVLANRSGFTIDQEVTP
jgi:glycosyltransferase involved in cell wall biosynthesis